ncbi:MAG: aryl-sulfate sulfotransferase [Myxococcales bacterium]|nr:aryl-sulfate sulfotransferase [Myxococcales bacterium]
MGPKPWVVALAVSGCASAPLQVSGTASEHVPAVLLVDVEIADNGVVWVEYGDGHRTDGKVVGPGMVTVPVVGMKAGHRVAWRVVVDDSDGGSLSSETFHFDVPEAPGPSLEVFVAEAASSGGHILTSSLDRKRPFVGIVDRDGDWVWWKETELWRVPTVRLSHDGQSVMWGEWADDGTSDLGSRLFRLSLDGTEPVEETWLPRGHHDFVDHGDGRVAFLSLGWRDEEGRDFPVATDRIELTARGAGPEVVPQVLFDTFTTDPVPEGPWCSHTTRANVKFGQQVFELTHGNSLAYVAEEQAYYVNAKFTDWLMKIDAATGAEVWQLSGPGGDFTLPDGSAIWHDHDDSGLFSHGHMSDIWPGGLLMFDNGDHRAHRVSRVVRIDVDEQARTARIAWTYDHPAGRHTPTMGDARRLATGNVLTSWASLGEIREISPEGLVVWSARIPDGDVGRVTWLPDLSATTR